MNSMWNNQEDFEQDLDSYSELGVIDTIPEPTPPSIVEYNARVGANRNCSIYDTPCYDDTGVILNRGRGRGRGSFKFFQPNQISNSSTYDDEEEIRRRLKVVGGIGHSNEIIEANYRHKTGKSSSKPKNDENEFSDIPEMTLQDFSNNLKKLKNSNNARSSPNVEIPNTNGISNSRSNDLDTSDPCIIEEEVTISNSSDPFPPLGSESGRSSRSGSERSLRTESVRSSRPESVHSSRPESVHSAKSESAHSPLISSPTNQLSKTEDFSNSSPSLAETPLPLSVLLNRARKGRRSPDKSLDTKKIPDSNSEVRLSPKNHNMVNGKSPRSSKTNETESLGVSNDFWWNHKPRVEAPLAWRQKNNSPVRFFNKTGISRFGKKYDIQSKTDFPTL